MSDEDGVDVARFDGAVVTSVGSGASGGVVGAREEWVLEIGDHVNVIDLVVAGEGWGVGVVQRGFQKNVAEMAKKWPKLAKNELKRPFLTQK